MEIQSEIKEEKMSLSDFDFNFKILEQDRDKYTKVLNECKLKQDEFKDLKLREKDYGKIIVIDQQHNDVKFELEQAQLQLDELNTQKSIMEKQRDIAKHRN
jgi:bisphosphoglycerate-dependent phosphoglycerate mutase